MNWFYVLYAIYLEASFNEVNRRITSGVPFTKEMWLSYYQPVEIVV